LCAKSDDFAHGKTKGKMMFDLIINIVVWGGLFLLYIIGGLVIWWKRGE
jgi:hypothetical protein